MKHHALLRVCDGVLKQVGDAAGVERGRAADNAVHSVPLFNEELCQVRPILPGDAWRWGERAGSRLALMHRL